MIIEILNAVSSVAVPFIIGIAAVIMLFGKKDYFAAFSDGVKEGFKTCIGLLAPLSGLIVAVSMLESSGVVEVVCSFLAPYGEKIGVPAGLLPLLLTRPFSGSASLAAYGSLLEEYGADSFTSLCASVIMGSSDTFVYVISVYFAAAGVKHTRHAYPCAVFVMIFCIFFACFICRIWFGG